MSDNKNANTINFLSKECKCFKHESCKIKWIGLGFNFDCNCKCHKLKIFFSTDNGPNSRIREYNSSNLQGLKYSTRIETDESSCNSIKILKEIYSKNHTGGKESLVDPFSPVFPIAWQHIIESEVDSIHV